MTVLYVSQVVRSSASALLLCSIQINSLIGRQSTLSGNKIANSKKKTVSDFVSEVYFHF